MASKKTIKDGLSFGSDLDDLSLDSFDFGSPKSKNESKRRPITKIAFGAAKGMGRALTSESTIRNVIAKALPPGYSAVVDAAYDVSAGAKELYHSAADEWQKMEPDARRLVQKITPRTSRVLPKKLQDKLKNFAEGGRSSYQVENPDEAVLRRVMGELEGVSMQERTQERAEDQARDAIRGQMDGKRHRQSQRVLASIDARLAQINAFNDQAFARYQKRSLEVQYRSFFVQRDMLKVQMQASQDMREAMRALVHNTALPDMDKLTNSDRVRQGIRQGIRGAAGLGVNKFINNYFGDAKKRLKNHIGGVMSGVGSALSMGNMSIESAQMMREMGMDTTSMASQEAGSGLMNAILGHLAGHVSGGFRRSGATAQGGAQLLRMLGNAQTRTAKWAGKYDGSLLGQLLLNPLKDILGGSYQENRSIGKSASREAGDPGMFTKRTQRAVEEVMPEYLSRILHELQMTRQGSGVKRVVYNEDQNRFTTQAEQHSDLEKGLFQSGEAKMSRESVNRFASKFLGGAKISSKAYQALQQEIALMMHNGEELSFKKLQSTGKFLDAQDAREIRMAVKGRFRGNMSRGSDKTILADLDRSYRGAQSAIQSPMPYMAAAHDMGHTQYLMDQGLVKRNGDNYETNINAYIRRQYGAPTSEQHEYSRSVSEDMGSMTDWTALMRDSSNRRDLYKTADASGKPVIEARRVMEGAYTSMQSGHAIHFMHDLAGGVTMGGRTIATPEQVMKLYFPNGQTYASWYASTPRPEAGTGRLSRAQAFVHGKAKGFGAFADRKIDQMTGHARRHGLHTPNGRKAAVNEAAQSARATVQAAVQAGNETPQVQAAKAKIQTVAANAKKEGLKALASLKRAWKRAVSAAQYGQSLYEQGGTTAVIDEAKLRGGEYYSAVTGKPITDLRDMVDGVKTKAGTWVAHPEEILNLQTKKGYSFKTLMADLQAGMEQAQTKAQEHVQAAKATPAGQATVQAVEAAKAAVNASARSATDQFASQNVAAAPNETMESLLSVLTAFRDGNLEYLDHILEALHSGPVGSGGGSAEGKKKLSMMDRMRKTRLGMIGRWGDAAARGAGRAAGFAGRMYAKYVKGAFGLMGSAIKAPFKAAGWLLGGNKNHKGKVAADVFVGKERQPRLTAGGMLAGDYVWVDAKTGKTGGPVTCPADIKGPVMSADGSKTLISADDLRQHPVTDRFGYSIARRVLGFIGRGLGGLGGMYAAIFKVPFKVMGYVGSLVKDAITGRKNAVDIYVRGDNPWLPRVTAMGMQRGIYVTKGRLGNHAVRSLHDVTGDVYDISNGSPRLVLGPEDFAPPKGLCDIKGKPLHIRHGFLKKLAGGIWSGIGSGLGGLARMGGHMLSAGASLASMPFKFIKNLLTGQGLVNFNFGGGAKKGAKTSDEKTHDLLTEVLHLLDGRLPETEHYRRGSWQERLASKGKGAAGKMRNAVKSAGSGLGGLWSKLKGMFSKKDEDDDEDDDGDTTNNYYGSDEKGGRAGRDAKGRLRGSRARNRAAKRLRKLRGKGFRGAALEKELAKGGRFKRLLGKIPGMGRFGKAAGGLTGLLKKSKMLGKIGSGIGKLKGGIGGLVGGLLLDKYADSHKGTTMGKVAGGASTALSVGSTAATVAGLVGVDVAGAAAATAAGAGSAIAGGASATAALISNPVGWAILAAAAVAAAGYGIYKLVSKIHDLKKDEPFRAYRLAQYGFDIKEKMWKANDILKLENLLLPTVRMKGTEAYIDGKEYAKIENDVLRLFDLGYSKWNPMGYLHKWFHKDNVDDVKRREGFHNWLIWRFRPVFLTWYTALHSVSPSTQMADIDDKLKAEEKEKILTTVRALPQQVYAVTSSPFEDYPLKTGKAEQELLAATSKACDEAIKKQKKEGGKSGSGGGKGTVSAAGKKAAGATVAGAAAAATSKAGGDGKKNAEKADAQAKLTTATKIPTGLIGAGIPIAATASYQGKYAFTGGALTALQAVRYKTYGLKTFKPEQVKALFFLETDLLDKIDYDGNGVATYKGPIDFWFTRYAGYFGIGGDDTKAKARWYSWFSKRFLPTLLQFATAVRKADKNVDPRDADTYLNASLLLGVANQVIGANYSQDKQSLSVWTFPDSPFDEQPLNSDSKSTNDNIQVLKDNADKMVLSAPTAKPPTPGQAGQGPAPTTKPGMATQIASKTPAPAGSVSPTHINASAGGGISAILGNGPSTSVGKPVPQPGGGTGGDINKIPVPSGSGYTALRGTLDAAAKMVGVDPTVLATFAGIESGYNPGAHAKTSTAAGLGQFLKATWQSMMGKYAKTYGINPDTPPTDPRAAAIMLGLYIKDNAAYLKRVLGRDPTDTELYMAHFLGPGGAKQLIQMPDSAIAATYMPDPARSNQPIFYTKNGSPATRAQVVANLDGRVGKWRKLVHQEGPATATELATNTTKPGQVTPSGIAPPMSTGSRAASVAAAVTGGNASHDPVAASKSLASAKASAADAQAQATSMASSAQGSAMTTHAQAQTELQRQMVQYLSTIAGHTGRAADGLASMANSSSISDGTSATARTDSSTSTSSSGGGSRAPIPTTAMPAMTASMRRTVFADTGA